MPKKLPHLRVALVHDWLTGMRGGERVLEVLCELFPHATLFTLLHNRGSTAAAIERMEIRTSFVQYLPLKRERYRNYLPLFPAAIESFDLSGFDLIISSSHCVAKGVIPPPGSLHLCYCHTPMRYVWDMYEEYFGHGRAGWLTRAAMALAAPRLREWDVRTSGRVHHFIANSRHVAERIKRIYAREAEVIFAPVDTGRFRVASKDEGYYLVVSALVPYKRVDFAIDAFNKTGDRLVIAGTGPEMRKLKALSRPNIAFLGWQPDDAVARLYA
ncbi:MAG: glycosyltransferase, partial [Bacteroidota bacterium]